MQILSKILRLIFTAAALTAVAAIHALPAGQEKGPEKRLEKGTATDPKLTSEPASEPLQASLITCYPGPEIYELCGHSALRIRGEGIDSVWNYGVFDFNEPNFVYRFVKGETDYMVMGYPFSWFLPEYMARGSKVVEQDLNLSPAQTRKLRAILQKASLPENRRYRYNYIRDNCATRITDRLAEATGDSLLFPDSLRHTSFRNEMRAYHKDYPWYQFGIDIALGQGLDNQLTSKEQQFVPIEMMRDYRSATLADGRPLVKTERTLWEGKPDATLGPTSPFVTPTAVAIYLLVITLAVCAYDFKKKRISRWLWTLYFGAAGIAGCIVAFLVFVSEHDSTSPNLLILWLNPLQLLIPAFIWSRKCKPVVTVMMWLNLLTVGLMLICWPLQRQSANPAFFPLMATDIALALTWAIIARKESYNNKGVATSSTGYTSGRSSRGSASGRSRTAKPGKKTSRTTSKSRSSKK